MGGENLTMLEIEKASDIISREAHPEANIIFGYGKDLSMTDELRVTVIATGFPGSDSMYRDAEKNSSENNSTSTENMDLDLPPFLRNSAQ